MAATASIQITGTISSTPAGGRTIGPITLTSAAASGVVTQVVLANGTNTITVPSDIATSGCVIQLPSTNTAATTLKGVAGDTGVSIGKTGATLLSWDSTAAPSSFVLTSASAQTGKVTEIIWF